MLHIRLVGLALAVGLALPALGRAEQFVLFDVTFTFTKDDADNSQPSKSHYYVKGDRLNPDRPKDWTQPVDYRNGTVHIRTEVIEKPSGGEPTTWTLCYIPNKGQKNGYGCTGTTLYRERGVYEQDVPMTSFWQNDSIVWSEGIKQMDLVIKDGSGGSGHAHKRSDHEKFFPTKMRITMVQVSAGSKYDPSLVPNLPAKKEPARNPEDLAARLKERMEAAVRDDGFSGSVIVTKEHQPILRAGYGLANAELDVPNTPQTKFRLGSITKQFTAMAVMILQEQGKLSVDDPISKRLENAPPAWEPITIRHLLSHTSGIPSYTGFPQMMSRTVRQAATFEEVIGTFRDKELEFGPGERFAYSNSAYHLLGKIIERAAGRDYETFLREAIFQPLEMDDTGYDHNERILPRRAAGYAKTPEGLKNAPYIDMSWPYSSGALYSTVDDLARWDEALAAGKLVGPESYQAMFTPGKSDYGFGWFIRERSGRQEISHGGGIHGFSTAIVRYPREKVCVVVLSNIIPARTDKLAGDLAKIAAGLE